jgi:addiction module RelE/StbE family toxin
MKKRSKEIFWTPEALSDLRSIRDHISAEHPLAALDLADRIVTRVRRLSEFPRSGRVAPEFETEGYRDLVVSPYRIIYEISTDAVIVLRVWHSRRVIR